MTSNDNHDPVSRWATEHYGFADEPVDTSGQESFEATPTPTATTESRLPGGAPHRPHRRLALIASGVVGVAVIAGIGNAAAAAGGDGRDGRDGGPVGDRGAVVQLDRDGGGRAGGRR